MHKEGLLHKLLCSVIHLKRLESIKVFVSAALDVKEISVTSLGRNIKTRATERSNIRRSDRLIGNEKLHEEREQIYGVVVRQIVGAKTRPLMIVDWSHIPNTENYALRAGLVTIGRSLTLYEEVHAKKKENNPQVHRKFLKKLCELVPMGCKPIVITDAGFCVPWFKEVKHLGWDYIGRVRGWKYYREVAEETFKCSKDLYRRAREVGGYVGEVELNKEKGFITHLYLIRQKKKGRKHLNSYGKKSRQKKDKEHSSSAQEPWLLATSLGKGETIKRKVFKSYEKRMQIEEGFRDLKSSRYGLSLNQAYSKKEKRIEILLLLVMLVSFIAWLVGYIAEKKGWHYEFQVNSLKKKRVLSLFYLGCRVIKKGLLVLQSELLEAIKEIKRLSVWSALNHEIS